MEREAARNLSLGHDIVEDFGRVDSWDEVGENATEVMKRESLCKSEIGWECRNVNEGTTGTDRWGAERSSGKEEVGKVGENAATCDPGRADTTTQNVEGWVAVDIDYIRRKDFVDRATLLFNATDARGTAAVDQTRGQEIEARQHKEQVDCRCVFSKSFACAVLATI